MNKWLSTPAQHRTGFSAVALAALLLAGCGGGGGGSTPVTPPVVNPPVVNPPVVNPPVVPSAEISSTSLESSAQPVLTVATDIDDTGNVVVLFAQSNGSRVTLQVARGVPGARGVAPVFSAPEVIDATAPYDSALGQMGLTLSPNGNALARWMATEPCNAQTYNTAGNCKFVYVARRMAAGNWEAPVRVGDTPGTLPKAIINDVGDVGLLWPTWSRDAQNTLSLSSGVRWKANAASQFTTPTVFNDIQAPAGSDVGFTLDRQGNMVYLSLSTVGGQQTVVARRGSLTAGFGSTERLDTQTTDAQLEGIWGGVNGQVVVLWRQASAGQTLRWSAVLGGPSLAWQVRDLGVPSSSQRAVSAVGDNGDFFRYELDNCVATRRTAAGVWADSALPTGICSGSASFQTALSRTGDVVGGLFSPSVLTGNTGQWLAYDAGTNALTQSLSTQASGYLYGTPSTVGGSLLLSENGVAVLVSPNDFDVLPSATAPAGTRGVAANLWVTYLKLP